MDKNIIILFDLDGTLIDSTDAIIDTFYHCFETMDFQYNGTKDNIKELIGYPLDIMFKNLGVPSNSVWDFVDAYSNRYKEISKQQTTLLKDAKEAIQLASSFARLSVVTTKKSVATIPLLEHLGINKYFEIITGRDNVTNPKPHAEPILKTLNAMNFDKKIHTAWMIGDTKLDLISAKEAKINSVGLLCGYGKKEDLIKYSNHIKNNSLEAVNYIFGLSKN